MREIPNLTLEDELMKEKVKRLINRLYDEKNVEDLHEISHLLLNAIFQTKAAMYYFQAEACDNLTNETGGF